MHFSTLASCLLALVAAPAFAAPAMPIDTEIVERTEVVSDTMEARGIQCGRTQDLAESDCKRLQSLGWSSVGVNAPHSTGANSIYLGKGGKYNADFTNNSGKTVILVVWNQDHGYGSSFVQTNQPQITVSVAPHKSIQVSFDEGSSGAWSAIYPDTHMDNGQISNTWGEFSTGSFGTVDVSREVNMGGHTMSISTPGGCTSNMNQCVFVCKSGNKCGTAGSYALKNCKGPNTANGGPPNAPSGGCQGWANGGTIKVSLGN